MTAVKTIDVWYLCDQSLCNFDCAYCVTQPSRRSAHDNLWVSPDGATRFRRVLSWLAGLPLRIRVRVQTLGEPFVSRDFLDGAAWLTRQENVEFVELVTNGSFRQEQFGQFAEKADPARLSLWMTYHPTQIGLERLIESARTARALGASVVVHGLLFPDTIDEIKNMVAQCAKADIPADVTAGHNYNGAYADRGYVPILEDHQALSMYRDDAVRAAMAQAHKRVYGAPCSAGHDYLYIGPDGGVYPCSPYARASQHFMGSALDPAFVPALRPGPCTPCENKGMCTCKEDYLHLTSVRSILQMGRSLGYYVRPASVARTSPGTEIPRPDRPSRL
jgi:MoaA/NifB/PqqE/SkfB family radical SAM enzyme